MPEQRFDAVVIGAGPGGYPAAIRLGQLKVKTAIIEREYIGGVCLNVGCIPSKSVIHAAKTFEKMGHSDDIGISIASKPTLDMKKLQAWKGGVVNKLTSGVRTLLKANHVEIFDGDAKLEKPGADGHRITVKDGWHGAPEEQGFLRDVQGAACEMFTTVLAPGSNEYHYDHIHVDLMRRASGRIICQPAAMSGEAAAARAGGRYGWRPGAPSVTGSIASARRPYRSQPDQSYSDDHDGRRRAVED